MGQGAIVMGFRKRLKSAGYTNVRIVRNYGLFGQPKPPKDSYNVSATEPLGGADIYVTLTETEMFYGFKREQGTLSSTYSKGCHTIAVAPRGGVPSTEGDT